MHQFDRGKRLKVSPHLSSVVCSQFCAYTLCAHHSLNACNNLSFMNCILQCEIIYCLFRFMSPPQPSLSSCICCSETRLNQLTFVSVITDLTASYHSDPLLRRFSIFQTTYGWCGRAPYNRARGWGSLNALILLQGAGKKALTQWKVVILYSLQPYSYSTLHTSHIKPL